MDYEYACKGGWSKDDPLVVHFHASSIQLDLKEQEKDPWKIVPLTSPPEVSTVVTCTVGYSSFTTDHQSCCQ